MTFNWSIFIDLGILSAALLLATLVRARVPFFQKYLIPNALTAGFIALPFYNFIAPGLGLDISGLRNLVYHLLSISFIAMTLRKSENGGARGKMVLSTSLSILSQYSVQCLLGFGLGILLMLTMLPKIFPGFGLFLTMGFSLGPGQAFAMGTGWEKYGFDGAGTVGLTFGAIGFIWACFGGMTILNLAVRRGWIKKEELSSIERDDVRTGIYDPDRHMVGSEVKTEPEAIDPLTFNVAFVFVAYLLSFLFLKLITWLLSFAGNAGNEFAWNLWGISFIFAALTASVMKKIISLAGIDYLTDNGSLNRISGLSVDLMVAASIGAISLVVVRQYWMPILLVSTIGGIVTTVLTLWISSRLFDDHVFHRTILIYGTATGTLPTGLALLRVIDPDFETPASRDYMYSVGITFLLAIPMILTMNLVSYGFTTGDSLYYWIIFAVYSGYMIFVLVAYRILSGKRAFSKPHKIWYR